MIWDCPFIFFREYLGICVEPGMLAVTLCVVSALFTRMSTVGTFSVFLTQCWTAPKNPWHIMIQYVFV